MADSTTIQVQVLTVRETRVGTYTDALYFPLDQIPDQKDIDATANARAERWAVEVEAAQTAEPPEPPSEDEKFAAVRTFVLTDEELAKLKLWLTTKQTIQEIDQAAADAKAAEANPEAPAEAEVVK